MPAAIGFRLMLHPVKIKTIGTEQKAQSPVPSMMQGRPSNPRRFAGERLGGNDIAPASVRDGGGLDDTVSCVKPEVPKLTLRHIRDAASVRSPAD